MVPNRRTLIVTLILTMLSAGCTDREIARRTGDSSDTFKYQPPAESPPPPPKKETDKTPSRDGSDTFHYQRDPRTYPKQPKKSGE